MRSFENFQLMNSDFNINEISKDIMTRYEALQKENIALKAELAELKAKLLQEEKPSIKSTLGPKSSSNWANFFQIKTPKTSIHTDWIPLPYDFSDSVLSLHYSNIDQQHICCFGTADCHISIFNLDILFPNLFDEKNITFQKNSKTINSKPIASYEGHHGAINWITQDPNSGLFASTSGDGTTQIWSVPQLQSIPSNVSSSLYREESNEYKIATNAILPEHNGPVLAASWSDGTLYTISGTNVSSWNITRSRRISTEDLGSNTLSIDSSENSPIIIGLISGEVKIWDTRDKSGIHKLFYEKESGAIISLKNSENYVITACEDKVIKKIDLRNGSKIIEIQIDHVPTKIDLNENSVLVPVEDGRIRIVNLKTEHIYVFDSNPFSYTTSSAMWINNNTALCASWDGSASIAQFPIF